MRISYLVAGAAVAALSIPAAAIAMPTHSSHTGGQITGHDVKNGSLTGADIKNHSIQAKDLDPKVLTRLGGTVGDGLATVTRVNATGLDATEGDTSFSYSVNCPAGQTVLSGGAFAMAPGATISGSYPGSTTDSSAEAWTARITNKPDGGLVVDVFALCIQSAS